ncbi:MAG TPA: GH25 family lysozyme [Actinomycetota bacterium]|jgi:GH25 family lysozyme M1 (1,4-beta-N-acetylmuramidase)
MGAAPAPPIPILPVGLPGTLPGIDVSHHQDEIDWAEVAGSGVRFAVAKATEGRTFVDPRYEENKVGAMTNGVAFTAYHFARPDDTPNDAVREADHFLDVAGLEPGNLIPALDIERTGGLSDAEITEWILEWLDHVTERLGVRPMVYTSPNGWLTRTGDTTAVAEAGYTVLWVAHWNVSEPRLPAEDWAGNGWTFWQYSNCGAIPGIGGCVDLDRFDGTSFDPVTIPSPDVTPPSASFSTPTDVAGPVTISFDEVVRQVGPDNTYVWTPLTGTYPPVSRTCRSRQGVEVDCFTGNVRSVIVQPLEPLVPGETYQAVVNPGVVQTGVVDRGGNLVPTSVADFAAPTEVEESSPAVSYAWRSVSADAAFGGRYAVERRAGATAAFAFRGRSVTWYTATGPTMGRAAVRIDGVPAGTFDQYASRTGFAVARVFGGLERGEHTITVRVLGTGSASATDTRVVVDAFETGGDLVRNPALDARWSSESSPGASGGSVASSDLQGASAEFTFRGTAADWLTVRGPHHGRAEIWVDGLLLRTVDNYAPQETVAVARHVTGLVDGLHTIRIVVLGQGRQAAEGTLVAIDRFAVVG